MPMGQSGPIQSLKPETEMYLCPACSYSDGFHVSFNLSDPDAGTGEIILICPRCHERLRPGWSVALHGHDAAGA